MVFGWYIMEAWGKSGEELRIILRLVGETFMNQWKNIYPFRGDMAYRER